MEVFSKVCQEIGIQQRPELCNFFEKWDPSSQTITLNHVVGLSNLDIFAFVKSFKMLDGIGLVNSIVINQLYLGDKTCAYLLECLKSACPNLTNLELIGNHVSKRTCTSIAHLLLNFPITRLRLGNNQITDDDVAILAKALASNTSLTQLHLGGNNIKDRGIFLLVDALMNHPQLQSFGLRDNKFNAHAMSKIATLMQSDGCRLSDLQLKSNKITDSGIRHYANGLLNNIHLRVIELPSTGITCVELLARNLVSAPNVHAINLNNNNIRDKGVISLCVGIIISNQSNNQKITTLGLRKTCMTSTSAPYLAQVLDNTGLTGLDVGENRLSNKGVRLLARSIGMSLASLDISENTVYYEGILPICESLMSNSTLTNLDVSGNPVGDDGAVEVANMLYHNKTLTRVGLADCCINDRGGRSLLHCINHNGSVRILPLGGSTKSSNNMAPQIRKKIKTLLSDRCIKQTNINLDFCTTGYSDRFYQTNGNKCSTKTSKSKYVQNTKLRLDQDPLEELAVPSQRLLNNVSRAFSLHEEFNISNYSSNYSSEDDMNYCLPSSPSYSSDDSVGPLCTSSPTRTPNQYFNTSMRDVYDIQLNDNVVEGVALDLLQALRVNI